MKVTLMGMFEKQIRPAVETLQREFPNVAFDGVGNDEGAHRQLAAARSADVVVSGRFVSHKIIMSAKKCSTRFITLRRSSAASMIECVRDVMRASPGRSE